MTAQKQLWVLAGGNGAGKSTFYRLYLEPLGMHFINADIIAERLHPGKAESLSYSAARIAGLLREELLLKGGSFCFETVFSHPSKIDFMAQAKALGYEVVLVFIHLEQHQLNQARVMQRVDEGGHNVPAEKIIARIPRTLANIKTALPLADEAMILDNSLQSNPFRQVAHLQRNQVISMKSPLPAWAEEIVSEQILLPR